MNKPTTIYFDLDGTLYDLYSEPRWLERITVDLDATAYLNGGMLVDRGEFHALLDSLVAAGYRIGVLSWVAGGMPNEDGSIPPSNNRDWDSAVRAAKRAWIRENVPHASEVHIVKYGTPKHRIASDPHGILVDDNAAILASWTGQTIWAGNLMNELKGLVD